MSLEEKIAQLMIDSPAMRRVAIAIGDEARAKHNRFPVRLRAELHYVFVP